MTGRRELLIGGAATGLAWLLPVAPGRATPATMQAAIALVVGEGTPLRRGRIALEIPPLVENGNSVPLTVTVDSPMTAADHVRAIHLFNERNPQPDVISVFLGPRAGRAVFSTRIKLSGDQQVVAVAAMSDGSFWTASAEVIVTIAACVEEIR